MHHWRRHTLQLSRMTGARNTLHLSRMTGARNTLQLSRITDKPKYTED
jgi:hypothetical protein